MSWLAVEYRVIEGSSVDDLIMRVNAKMKQKENGTRWVPQGGVKTTEPRRWFQAMSKLEEV